MEFVEVMKRAQEMCRDFPDCINCPLFHPSITTTCWHKLIYEPEESEKAINEYIFRKAYLRRKENAAK